MLFRLILASILLQATVSFALTVDNINDGEEVRYPVVLLRGTVDFGETVYALNRSNSRIDGFNQASVRNGRFAILIELVPGENRITLSNSNPYPGPVRPTTRSLEIGRAETEGITLHYLPMTGENKVQIVYVTAQDGDASYATPYSYDRQNYEEKLDTAAKLMQTFTAEQLHAQGYGRRTFSLDLDENGRVKVRTVQYPMAREELLKLDGNRLYSLLYGWIDQQFPMNRNKNIVIMSFTDYDGETRTARAHTALGGGGQALFGGATLYTWPDSIRSVENVFLNSTRIDTARSLDDSAGRTTVWGVASTTIGATLHELGHALGLPHTADPLCIMSRGFDRFNRFFAPYEPPSSRNREVIEFEPGETARWSPYFAAQLAKSAWLQPDGVPTGGRAPSVEMAWDDEEILIRAPDGIAFLGYHVGDPVGRHHFDAPGNGVTEVRLNRVEARANLQTDSPIRLVVIDGAGNTAHFNEGDVRNPDLFIRNWRLLPDPLGWSGEALSPDVPAIIERLRVEPETVFDPGRQPGFYSFDLNRHYGRRDDAATYMLAIVDSPRERPMKLLAGFDDGIRVWVNGELVMSHPGLIAVPPDAHSAEIILRAGENTILVESTQGPGAWGVSIRLQAAG